jgi:hypothetical protein
MTASGNPPADDHVLRSAVEKGLISQAMAEDAQRQASLTQTRATELLIRKGVLTKHIVDNLQMPGVGAVANEPQLVAGFRILGALGKGGMGTVYRALQVSMNREVALKVIARQFASDPAFCERFLREARAAGQVNHPNVITCYDVGQDQEWLYMALELMTGGDASSLARENGGRLEERRALRVIADCARGLGALRRAGLIHRDIKPANIFISQDGIAKLGDLGLARSTSGDDRMTMTGAAMGTPAFMSPEQASGESDLDIRTDIYALGATLFSLLTGDTPFRGASAFAVVAKVINDPVPDPRLDNPNITDGAASVVLTAMAKDRAQRYLAPEAMIEDLERVLTGRSPQTAVAVERPAGAMLPLPQAATIITAKGEPATVATVPHPQGPPAGTRLRAPTAPTAPHAPLSPPSTRATAELPTVMSVPAGSTTALAATVISATADRHRRSRLGWYLGAAAVGVALIVLVLMLPSHRMTTASPMVVTPVSAPLTGAVATQGVAPAQAGGREPASAPAQQPVVQPPPHVDAPTGDEPLALTPTDTAPRPKEQLQPPPDVPVYQPRPPVVPVPVAVVTPVAAPRPPVAPTPPVTPAAPAPRPQRVIPPAPPSAVFVPMSEGQLEAYRSNLRNHNLVAVVNDSGSGTISVAVDPATKDLSALDGLPVAHLACDGCTRLSDLTPLKGLPLKTLSLNGCTSLSTIMPLLGKNLVALDLSNCENLSGDLQALAGMALRELRLGGCRHLTALAGIESAQLTTLDLTDCRKLTTINALAGMPLQAIHMLHCYRLADLEALRGMPLLELELSDCEVLTSIAPVHGSHLKQLVLDNCRHLSDLQGLDGMPLRQLELSRCPQLKSLSGIGTTSIRGLIIVHCDTLSALDGVQGNPLTTIEITACPQLAGDLSALQGMPLREITLRDCGSLTSLHGVEQAPLRRVVVVSCRHLQDLSAAQRPGVDLVTEHN